MVHADVQLYYLDRLLEFLSTSYFGEFLLVSDLLNGPEKYPNNGRIQNIHFWKTKIKTVYETTILKAVNLKLEGFNTTPS